MAQGYSIAVKLVDEATGPLAKINRAIFGLESTANKANAGSRKVAKDGLPLVRDALSEVRKQTAEVGDGLLKAFAPLETFAIAASAGGIVAGLGAMAKNFADVGTSTLNMSRSLGLNIVDLQTWRGAADLAGIGADSMTSSLSGVAHGVYMARNGLNPDLFRAAQQFGIDLNKGATDAEKAQNTILQVSDKIRNDPLLKGNVQAQHTLLSVLGIDDKMLPLLQKGRVEIASYIEEAKKHGYLTEQQAADASALQRAYVGLNESINSTSLAIGGQVGTWLTPMLKSWSDWLDKARATPGVMKEVTLGGEVLAGVLGVSMVSGIAKLTLAMNSLWLSPMMRFLVSPAGAAAISSLEFLTSNGIGGLLPSKKELGSDFNPGSPPKLEHDWLQRQFDWIYNLFGGHAGHTSYTTQTTPMDDAAKKRIADAVAAYQKLGWSHDDAVAIAANQLRESGLINKTGDWGTAQGIGQWHPDRQANFRKLFGHDLKDATLDEQYRFTDWELRHTEADAAQRLRAAKGDAAKAAVLSRYYERPKAQDFEAGQRASLAEQIERMLSPIGSADAAGRMVSPGPVGGKAAAPVVGRPTVTMPKYPSAPPIPDSGLSAKSPALLIPPTVPPPSARQARGARRPK